MASAREERMQQRLRGAQRRQVKDVDFGLTFSAAPAPLQEVGPNRRTPQPELPPQLSSRTHATRGRPADMTNSQENNLPLVPHSVNDANTSAKRRKLDTDIPPSSSTRSTRSSRSAPRPDIYTLDEDEQQEPSVVENADPTIEPPSGEPILEFERNSLIRPPRSGRTPPVPARIVEEITESPRDAPGSGRRTSMLDEVVTEESLLQGTQQDESSAMFEQAEAHSPSPSKKRKRSEAEPKAVEPEVPRPGRNRTNQLQAQTDELDELSPEQPKRGRNRKPRTPIPERFSDVEEAEEGEESREPVEDREEAESINDEDSAALLMERRGRRVSRNMPLVQPRDSERAEGPKMTVGKTRRGKARNISSPVQQRQPKTNAKASQKTAKTPKLRNGNPIPVTVHRMTSGPLYDEDESDADILNAEIPHARRGGVNAVDVLSQMCQEIIAAALDTLEGGESSTEDRILKREYKTKWKAVDSFGKELQTRLLEHTINLDNVHSLEKRVRDEQKKKLGLREEILRIRAEREQVALRMDEIRIKHENGTKVAQERDALNTAIHDIELAVERGKAKESADDEKTGIELLLRRVAGEVSIKSGSGGVLKQIKEFNGFLERAALALEGRKV